MNELFNFAVLSFASLFTMINPLGVIPVFVTMSADLAPRQRLATARKASITAFLLLLLFGLTGRFIFQFFGISVDSLRVVGGVIFFFIGYDMLQARLTRTKHDEETVSEYVNDIAITPLAIPIICGPGAIATVIVLINDASSIAHHLIIYGTVLVLITLTYLGMIGGDRVLRFFGNSGTKVMVRLMGLIVMVIAVEFFFGGLRPIIRDILMITPASG